MRFEKNSILIFITSAAAAFVSSLLGQFLLRPSVSYTESSLIAFIVGLVMVLVFGENRKYQRMHNPEAEEAEAIENTENAEIEEDDLEEEGELEEEPQEMQKKP